MELLGNLTLLNSAVARKFNLKLCDCCDSLKPSNDNICLHCLYVCAAWEKIIANRKQVKLNVNSQTLVYICDTETRELGNCDGKNIDANDSLEVIEPPVVKSHKCYMCCMLLCSCVETVQVTSNRFLCGGCKQLVHEQLPDLHSQYCSARCSVVRRRPVSLLIHNTMEEENRLGYDINHLQTSKQYHPQQKNEQELVDISSDCCSVRQRVTQCNDYHQMDRRNVACGCKGSSSRPRMSIVCAELDLRRPPSSTRRRTNSLSSYHRNSCCNSLLPSSHSNQLSRSCCNLLSQSKFSSSSNVNCGTQNDRTIDDKTCNSYDISKHSTSTSSDFRSCLSFISNRIDTKSRSDNVRHYSDSIIFHPGLDSNSSNSLNQQDRNASRSINTSSTKSCVEDSTQLQCLSTNIVRNCRDPQTSPTQNASVRARLSVQSNSTTHNLLTDATIPPSRRKYVHSSTNIEHSDLLNSKCKSAPVASINNCSTWASPLLRLLARSTSKKSSWSRMSSQLATSMFTLMLVALALLPNVAESCSSRSTPRPRPSSPTLRPNITFQTYACPPAYAAWYCLNGATCFTVKIGESILYNCECADGYMGQRCEFKDLDGSYLPTREKVLLETASIAGGATVVIVLVFFVVFSVYLIKNRDNYNRELEGLSRINININSGSASMWSEYGATGTFSARHTYLAKNWRTVPPSSVVIPPPPPDAQALGAFRLTRGLDLDGHDLSDKSAANRSILDDRAASFNHSLSFSGDQTDSNSSSKTAAAAGGQEKSLYGVPSRVVKTVTTITDMASIYTHPRQEVHQVEVLQQVNVLSVDQNQAFNNTTFVRPSTVSAAATTALREGSMWQDKPLLHSTTSLTWQQFKAKSWLFSNLGTSSESTPVKESLSSSNSGFVKSSTKAALTVGLASYSINDAIANNMELPSVLANAKMPFAVTDPAAHDKPNSNDTAAHGTCKQTEPTEDSAAHVVKCTSSAHRNAICKDRGGNINDAFDGSSEMSSVRCTDNSCGSSSDRNDLVKETNTLQR